MKLLKLLFIILSATIVAKAQTPISIVNADMPNVNDTIRISTSTSDITYLLNDTGANKTWDATGLVASFQDMIQCNSVANTNIAYLLSFASSSFGIQDANINLGLVSGSEVFNFFSKNTSRYATDGRGFEFNGIPVPQVYTSKDIVYKFPLTYGSADSSNFSSNQTNVVVASIKTNGLRKNKVDAWGNLTTPYGTFNCIRIKSTVQQTDSIDFNGFSFPFTSNRTEYKWLAKGQKIPILQIVTTVAGLGQVSTSIQYRDINRPSVFQGNARFTANKTNFVVQNNDTCILTSNSRNNPKAYIWTISPSTYQFTGGTNANSNIIKVFFNDTGKYTITLRAIYNAGFDDTTRFEYINVVTPPKAYFGIVAPSILTTSSTVLLIDSSTGNPPVISWMWNFVPNSITFLDGTSANMKNPKVRFDIPSVYSISLKVSNSVGSNTYTKENYVVVPTAVQETLSHQYSVYPNPITNDITVSSTLPILFPKLKNIIGQDCNVAFSKQGDVWKADCTTLKQGIYFLYLESTNGDFYCTKVYKY